MTQKKIDWSLEVRKFERKCACRWVGNRRIKAYRIACTPEASHHSMLCAYRARQHAESNESEMHTFRIGSTLVRMSANQAESWNAGEMYEANFRGATVDAIVDDGGIERGKTYDLWSWIDGNDEWPARARDMEGEYAHLVTTLSIGGAA